jgi:uncharacterized protein (TIGR03435 family)
MDVRFACAILLALPMSAQQFEVASVKLSAGDELNLPAFLAEAVQVQMRMQGGPGTPSPERITYTSVTMKMLLQRAYNLRPQQIEGPDWFDTQRYTITATLPPKTTPEQLRLMLQNLLADRFKLRLHRETRTFRTYHLVVARNGPKLKPAEEAPAPAIDPEERRKSVRAAMEAQRAKGGSLGNNGFHQPRATMAELAELLAQRGLDHPVIDETHLDGRYACDLTWTSESARQRDDGPQGPTIFAALQEQLGLELKSATDQLPVLVIDAAGKIPIEN